MANRGPSLDQSPQFFAALDRFPAAARVRLTWGRGRLSTKCIFIHVSLPSGESSVLFALLSTGKFFVPPWQLSAASGFRSQPIVVALRKKMWQRLCFTRSSNPAVQDKQTVFFRAESCQLAVPRRFPAVIPETQAGRLWYFAGIVGEFGQDPRQRSIYFRKEEAL